MIPHPARRRFSRALSLSRIRSLSLSVLLASLGASPASGAPAEASAPLPAFPGAEGFGAGAKGGRGGDVYIVTNLDASGPGSFAEGVATIPESGRTIVFAVSGYIPVPPANKFRINGSRLTIAGQTAPGDGIGFQGGCIRIVGDDVVVRHARFRHGRGGSGGDCIDIDAASSDVILDHVTMQFSTDENMSSFGKPPENVTLQYSFNAWGLETHSCGGLWDQNHATAHHTLWAHNHTRNPKARPNGLLEWINNVTFDWDIGFILGDSKTPASWQANVVGSYFLSPPGNLRKFALEKANIASDGKPNFHLYLDKNLHDADGDGRLNGTDKGYAIASGDYTKPATPFPGSPIPVTVDDALTAFKKIVSAAGPLRLDVTDPRPLRDEVDTLLVANLVAQRANHIKSEAELPGVSAKGMGTLASTPALADTDRDGLPDVWEKTLGTNPAAANNNTAFPAAADGRLAGVTFFPAGTRAGYTHLEEYLHFLAIPHGIVAKNKPVTIDLRKFTAGFTKNAQFTLAGVIGGKIAQAGPGGAQVTFTPAKDFTGRARFEFTVKDADGSTWTQTCALLITAP